MNDKMDRREWLTALALYALILVVGVILVASVLMVADVLVTSIANFLSPGEL